MDIVCIVNMLKLSKAWRVRDEISKTLISFYVDVKWTQISTITYNRIVQVLRKKKGLCRNGLRVQAIFRASSDLYPKVSADPSDMSRPYNFGFNFGPERMRKFD